MHRRQEALYNATIANIRSDPFFTVEKSERTRIQQGNSIEYRYMTIIEPIQDKTITYTAIVQVFSNTDNLGELSKLFQTEWKNKQFTLVNVTVRKFTGHSNGGFKCYDVEFTISLSDSLIFLRSSKEINKYTCLEMSTGRYPELEIKHTNHVPKSDRIIGIVKITAAN